MSPHVVSVNVSTDKGTPKRPVPFAVIGECGIEGDAHAGAGHRQVSLLSLESIERFSAEMGRSLGPGEFAENITTSGADLSQVGVGDRLRVGECELEVTQIGKECHGEGCAIFRDLGKCVMPREGIFTRVVRGGRVKPDDPVGRAPRPTRT